MLERELHPDMREPRLHITSRVIYAKCTNGICIVVWQTVALERTLVTVEYEEKKNSQCTALDKMMLFHVETIIIASIVVAPGQLKKEEKKIKVSTHADLQL